jgi:serine/threonine-protein kinase RsbW
VNKRTCQRLLVQPTLQDVARAVQELERLLPPRLRGTERHAVEAGLAEVLTNIVEHGFADAAGVPIDVCCECSGRRLVIEVRDDGRPVPAATLGAAGPETFDFDPTDLGALPEGGLGLAIVKAAFDVVEYHTEGSVNCMRLEKYLR